MTALILYENNELSDLVSISYPDNYSFEGKVAYLSNGSVISVEQLLEFLLVYSANDSAYATAMHISNSVDDFVKLMNSRAKQLNMKDTNFQNPDGLDQENHYTTLYDLLLLSEYILKNTKLIDITNKSKFYYEQNNEIKKYENTNSIINKGFRGLKTGWTSKAGLTFIGYNQDDNRNIITIVNKSFVDDNKQSHFDDTIFLYEKSLTNFQDNILLKESDYVYKIINPYETSAITYDYNIFKFGDIRISNNVYLLSIDKSEIILGNYFDNENIKISSNKSYRRIHYNFVMSNIISKLLASD